jgi:hypothetical protein
LTYYHNYCQNSLDPSSKRQAINPDYLIWRSLEIFEKTKIEFRRRRVLSLFFAKLVTRHFSSSILDRSQFGCRRTPDIPLPEITANSRKIFQEPPPLHLWPRVISLPHPVYPKRGNRPTSSFAHRALDLCEGGVWLFCGAKFAAWVRSFASDAPFNPVWEQWRPRDAFADECKSADDVHDAVLTIMVLTLGYKTPESKCKN